MEYGYQLRATQYTLHQPTLSYYTPFVPSYASLQHLSYSTSLRYPTTHLLYQPAVCSYAHFVLTYAMALQVTALDRKGWKYSVDEGGGAFY
eukprot:2178916-Rhodomonas_salina.1